MAHHPVGTMFGTHGSTIASSPCRRRRGERLRHEGILTEEELERSKKIALA